MKNILNLKNDETIEWRCLKFGLAAIWISMVQYCLGYSNPYIFEGFCAYFPCSIISNNAVKIILNIFCLISAVMYIMEVKIKFILILMIALSILIFSYEEANGQHSRNAILSLIFISQFIATFTQNSQKNRILFSVQSIATIYVIAGISKLISSGPSWVLSGNRIFLPIKKSAYFNYLSDGNTQHLTNADTIIELLSIHPWIIPILLTLVLCLELGSFMLIVKPEIKLIYGLLLLCMHIGIKVTMDILVFPIFWSMVMVLINPIYLVCKLFIKNHPRLNSA